MQPGSPGMGMEGRKAAPALRARFLRSYVPLRRVRAGARPPAPYPDSPAALSHSQFQIQTGRKEDRTLSADTGIVLCADV